MRGAAAPHCGRSRAPPFLPLILALILLLPRCCRRCPLQGKCFVDVRDAATAHVLALEDGAAEGRYLLIAQSAPWRVFASELRDAVPWAPVPTVEEEGACVRQMRGGWE